MFAPLFTNGFSNSPLSSDDGMWLPGPDMQQKYKITWIPDSVPDIHACY
jgi:hypothetical protein